MMDIGFAIKKFLGTILSPLPVCLILLFIGFILLYSNRRRKGAIFCSISVVLLLLFSMPITSRYLIWPIEFHYPKLALDSEENIATLRELSPKYIVVLGCWHNDDNALPLVAKFHQCSLARIVHAVKIWRLLPDAKVIFSGNVALKKEGVSHPELSARLATDLGLPERNIVKVVGAKDTEEGINLYKNFLQEKRFIVVSSATHMIRIKYLFEQYGLDPILAPAEYVSAHGSFSWQLFVPNSSSLQQSERAIYEILGNAWVTIKFAIN